MKRLLFVLLLVTVYFIYDLLFAAGFFLPINPYFDGESVKIYTGAPGPEDIDIDYENGLIFVSSTDRRKQQTDSMVMGNIFLIRPDSLNDIEKIWHNYSGQFRPHGISYLKTDGQAFLFAINHNNSGNFVEKFEFRNDSLFHMNSYKSPDMFSPNDLVAVDNQRFYVTNDHGFRKGSILRTLEDYLRLPKSYVLYYDGVEFKIVVDGLRYANGINISNDTKQLYVTQTTGQEFRTYQILEDGALKLKGRIEIKSGLDNIEVDPSGKIWIGSHPKMLDFVAHAKNPSNHSPSQAFTIDFIDEQHVKVKEVFLDDGGILSGSSVAVPYKGDVFIGAVYEDKVFRGRFALGK